MLRWPYIIIAILLLPISNATIGTSQWGGSILDNNAYIYYDFATDCSDVMGNINCTLSNDATVVDGKLFLNRTANNAMRAQIFQQDFDLPQDFCIAFDVDNYDYSDARFLHFQDNDQLDLRLSSGKMFVSYKNSTGSYKSFTGSGNLPNSTSKWTYIISFDTTSSEIVSWLNGTTDINATTFQGFNDLTDITMQFPRNTYAGIGYMDNLVFMNSTCNQSFVDSWMTAEEEEEGENRIACYSFDADYSDDEGTLANFTERNTPSISTSFKKLGAGSLNLTSSDSALYGVYINETISDYPFSFNVWVYKTSWNNNNRIAGFDGGGYNSVMGASNTASSRVALIQSGGNAATTGTDAYINAEWVMVTAVYNSSIGMLYVNGANVVNVTSTAWHSKYDRFVVGMYSRGLMSDYLNGYIDELSIYNTTLSQEYIDELYNSSSGMTCAASEEEEEPPAEDSCTYTSGNWQVNLSDSCEINTSINIGSNCLVLTGSGNFSIESGGSVTAACRRFEPDVLNGNSIFAIKTGGAFNWVI